jgi:hypothetical protein
MFTLYTDGLLFAQHQLPYAHAAHLYVQASSLLCFLLTLALQPLNRLVCCLHIDLQPLQLILQDTTHAKHVAWHAMSGAAALLVPIGIR